MKLLVVLTISLFLQCALSLNCTDNNCYCPQGEIVDRSAWCDGIVDCIDEFDEADETCKFFCNDSANTIVSRIQSGYPGQVCDGHEDCLNGEDELNCQFIQRFTCGDGNKITQDHICDGIEDCQDGLDEFGCGMGCTSPLELACNNLTIPHKYMLNSCYTYAEIYSFASEGASKCTELNNGHLAYVKDANAFEKFVAWSNEVKLQIGKDVYGWIGLTRDENDNWKWSDGEPATDSTVWGPNFNATSVHASSCAEIDIIGIHNDPVNRCDYPLPIVCQYDEPEWREYIFCRSKGVLTRDCNTVGDVL